VAIREKRAVKKSLFTPGSKKYWNLKTEHARVLFVALLTCADDEGRLEGDPDDVKTLIPRANWSLEDILSYIKDLDKVELIEYYRVKGHWYIQIMKFWQHQDRHGVMQELSEFPSPPKKRGEVSQENQEGVFEKPIGDDLRLLPTPLSSPLRKEESEEETKCDWSSFARKYRHLVGRKPHDHKPNRKLYAEACSRYGEEKVLAALERCIPDQSEEFMAKQVFTWKFLKDTVHEFIEEPEHGTVRKRKLSKAEEREENNRKVFERVLGSS